MEITYETIIKYLVPKNIIKKTINEFITQKNIISYSKDFPETFKNLLTEHFYRYGITVYDNENNNISFWSSLLTLLNDKYILTFENEELPIINNIKSQFIGMHKNIIENNSLLKDFDIKENIKLEPNEYVLQYIVDCLDINFIILDFNTNEIQVLYKNNNMNPYKQSLIFAKSDNYYEPIMCNKMKENKRLFDINDITFKKILNYNNIKYYSGMKEFSIQNNILDIIMNEKNDIIKLNEKNENNNIFIPTSIDISTLNNTKLNKMKVKELQQLAIDLQLNIKKKALKIDLINSIIEKIGIK